MTEAARAPPALSVTIDNTHASDGGARDRSESLDVEHSAHLVLNSPNGMKINTSTLSLIANDFIDDMHSPAEPSSPIGDGPVSPSVSGSDHWWTSPSHLPATATASTPASIEHKQHSGSIDETTIAGTVSLSALPTAERPTLQLPRAKSSGASLGDNASSGSGGSGSGSRSRQGSAIRSPMRRQARLSINTKGDGTGGLGASEVAMPVLSLDEVMDIPQYCYVFEHFCINGLCHENLSFMLAVRAYQKLASPHKRRVHALRIFEAFLADNAPYQINVDAQTRHDIASRFLEDASTALPSSATTPTGASSLAIPAPEPASAFSAASSINSATSSSATPSSAASDESPGLDKGATPVSTSSSSTLAGATPLSSEKHTGGVGAGSRDLFNQAFRVVHEMTVKDVFPRFLASDEWKEITANSSKVSTFKNVPWRMKRFSFTTVPQEEDLKELGIVAAKFKVSPGCVKPKSVHLKKYKFTFRAKTLIAWLMHYKVVTVKAKAIAIGQRMLDAHLIHGVSPHTENHFSDGEDRFAFDDPIRKDNPSVNHLLSLQHDKGGDKEPVTSGHVLIKGVKYNRAFIILRPKTDRLYCFAASTSTEPHTVVKHVCSSRIDVAVMDITAAHADSGAASVSYFKITTPNNQELCFRLDSAEDKEVWLKAFRDVSIEITTVVQQPVMPVVIS